LLSKYLCKLAFIRIKSMTLTFLVATGYLAVGTQAGRVFKCTQEILTESYFPPQERVMHTANAKYMRIAFGRSVPLQKGLGISLFSVFGVQLEWRSLS
jgi:hypothetical protein